MFISLIKSKRKNLIISYIIISCIVGIFFLRGLFTTNLYMPKPKGYIRLEIPKHSYVILKKNLPYVFEYSKHSEIKEIKDSKNSIDIYYPKFKASIHITYMPIKNDMKLLKEHWDLSYKLSAAHQVQASEIKEEVFTNPNGIKITLIELFGEHIASQYQFITTDYKKHFLRGVLYFNLPPDQNYLAPMILFIKKDIRHMLDTLKWT